jgi:hypothetical protein
VSRPPLAGNGNDSFPPKQKTLKNVEQTFLTKVVFAAVLRIRDTGFGAFLNPEPGNRDPGTGMKKIGSGIFLTFVLG